jgi:hypothetical protein
MRYAIPSMLLLVSATFFCCWRVRARRSSSRYTITQQSVYYLILISLLVFILLFAPYHRVAASDIAKPTVVYITFVDGYGQITWCDFASEKTHYISTVEAQGMLGDTHGFLPSPDGKWLITWKADREAMKDGWCPILWQAVRVQDGKSVPLGHVPPLEADLLPAWLDNEHAALEGDTARVIFDVKTQQLSGHLPQVEPYHEDQYDTWRKMRIARVVAYLHEHYPQQTQAWLRFARQHNNELAAGGFVADPNEPVETLLFRKNGLTSLGIIANRDRYTETGYAGMPASAAVSPDGKLIACAGAFHYRNVGYSFYQADARLGVFAADSGKLIWSTSIAARKRRQEGVTVTTSVPLPFTQPEIRELRFSADGRYLSYTGTAEEDDYSEIVHVIDTSTWKEIVRVPNAEDAFIMPAPEGFQERAPKPAPDKTDRHARVGLLQALRNTWEKETSSTAASVADSKDLIQHALAVPRQDHVALFWDFNLAHAEFPRIKEVRVLRAQIPEEQARSPFFQILATEPVGKVVVGRGARENVQQEDPRFVPLPLGPMHSLIRYIDTNIKPGAYYVYRIEAILEDGTVTRATTARNALDNSDLVSPGRPVAPTGLRAIRIGEGVLLKWDYARDGFGSSSKIFRSVNGAAFQPLPMGHAPIGSYKFLDAPVTAGKLTYRVVAMAAEGGFESEPSAPVEVAGERSDIQAQARLANLDYEIGISSIRAYPIARNGTARLPHLAVTGGDKVRGDLPMADYLTQDDISPESLQRQDGRFTYEIGPGVGTGGSVGDSRRSINKDSRTVTEISMTIHRPKLVEIAEVSLQGKITYQEGYNGSSSITEGLAKAVNMPPQGYLLGKYYLVATAPAKRTKIKDRKGKLIERQIPACLLFIKFDVGSVGEYN